MDKLLAFLEPDESFFDLATRNQAQALHSGIPLLDRGSVVLPGSVLDVLGPPESYKTDLLLHITTTVLT